jgi:hypothetical protein
MLQLLLKQSVLHATTLCLAVGLEWKLMLLLLLLLLQIAMMGGNVEQLLQEQQEQGGKAARGPSTKPMPVQEFLDKGLGGAQLPRKQQDRKDKEKKKRAAGQSTHAQWKSEAEMVLRQQYD